jgi:hypothetical protein
MFRFNVRISNTIMYYLPFLHRNSSYARSITIGRSVHLVIGNICDTVDVRKPVRGGYIGECRDGRGN